MVGSDPSAFVAGLPWLEPGDNLAGPLSQNVTRGSLVLPYNRSPVTCDECKDPLPEVSRWTDSDRISWSRYELPRGDSKRPQSKVFFSLDSATEQQSADFLLGPGISRSLLDEYLETDELESPGEVPKSLKSYALQRDLIDTHTEFVNDLCDHVKSNRFYWEGNQGGLAIRSVFRVTSRWLKSDERDTARLALIVKLAREIARVLAHVCDHPRVVLRRTREFQKIAKIQEVDPACLRWLARQPGRDVYERAGARQQLLGVVRKEDTDTPENRVVKDLLHRARLECANYVSIYREFIDHERVRTVMNFRRQIAGWERQSEINRAKRLVGPVQPNYVLLHEPKYRKLWDAYQLLLSQQKQKDDIWKWRDRTFAEICEFAALSVIRKKTRRSPFTRSDVAIEQESITGQFISKLTEPGSARFKTQMGDMQFVFCRGVHANRCPYVPRGFYPLSADFYLITHDGHKAHRIVPVWCLFEPVYESLEPGLCLLEKKLERLPNPSSIRPIILVFDASLEGKTFFGGNGGVVPLGFPMLNWFPLFEQVVLLQLAVS